MKKILFLILPVLLFSNGACENSEDTSHEEPVATGSNEDLTSKESILKHFQNLHEDLDENDICIEKVQGFDQLFVVGYFAHDRGCSVNSMFFKGKELPGDHSGAHEIMAAHNYKKEAEKHVENYHIQVINMFKTVVRETNEDFESNGTLFSAPVTFTKGGYVVSQLWIKRPSGMIKENSYYLSTLTFDDEGNYVSLEKSNQFSIAY